MSFIKTLLDHQNKKAVFVSLFIGLIVGYATGILYSPTGSSKINEPIGTTERTPSTIELQTTIRELETRISEIEAVQKPQGLPAPDYDSGWLAMEPESQLTIEHGLNTYEILVYLVGKQSYDDVVHQFFWGGFYWHSSEYVSTQKGVWWFTEDESSINVWRQKDDAGYDFIRVYIWKIPATN